MTKSFDIGGVPVGEGHPVFIVAELSANHAGKRDVALKTIEVAAKLGANAIKIQTYTADTLTLKSDAPPFVVKTKNEWAGRTLHDLYTEAMTPWEWHAELKACAEACGIPLFSTPFDPTAVEFLEQLGVPAHKVASFELVDLPLVEHVALRGKPMILSTGMATLAEIEAAVTTCRNAGNHRLALLRCVSSYPAKPEAMNLQSFALLTGFGTVVGLSDHTRDHTVAIASVALGAKIIEKHFILDRSVGGPDAFFSLEPSELEAMVKAVRDAERALGGPRFGASTDEKASLAFRRSLFVARDVKEGDVLTADDVRSVRPAHGLACEHMPAILGRRATRDLSMGTPLAWEMVGAAPETPALELRPATADDAARLLAWRNDPETRRQSRSHTVVTEQEHKEWLVRSLASNDRALFVAWQGNVAVGTVRVDRALGADGGTGGAWEVSIAVAPEQRGKKLAHALLRALEGPARAREARTLTARIQSANARSVAAFKRAGYYAFVERNADGESYLFCERRIEPYGGNRPPPR